MMAPSPWRRNPLLYEINTWAWLHSLSKTHDRPITLGTIPDSELNALAGWGFDAIWLMGVWQRSRAGQQIARAHPGLQDDYHKALPDFSPEDVVGSPYAIRGYEVDTQLGGRAELAVLRQQLAEHGLRLVLDYVPNHVAVDHAWLESNPEYFIQGTPDDLAAQPEHFFRGPGGHVFANGRDPYFPAWTDTAQLNAYSAALRARTMTLLLDIASQCDAVRCDMAMLMTNRIFQQTWGVRAGDMPETDYWELVIPAIKTQYPGFLFMAEVYWDMEWELQQQGFDYTYDKRLYDRLIHESARSITGHLYADVAYQNHMIRFIENHDEQRATTSLGEGRDLAAATLIATLPGAALLHDGQLTGRQIRLPVQLGRRPPEPDNDGVKAFYALLLREACHPIYHDGEWTLRGTVPAWDLNASHRSLIAYTWRQGDERRLVVVNYSATSSQGRVPMPDFDLRGSAWALRDVINQTEYERNGYETADHGLYVDLMPWKMHIFHFDCTGDCEEPTPED